jgi:hypothetical protein
MNKKIKASSLKVQKFYFALYHFQLWECDENKKFTANVKNFLHAEEVFMVLQKPTPLDLDLPDPSTMVENDLHFVIKVLTIKNGLVGYIFANLNRDNFFDIMA